MNKGFQPRRIKDGYNIYYLGGNSIPDKQLNPQDTSKTSPKNNNVAKLNIKKIGDRIRKIKYDIPIFPFIINI